MKEFLLYFLGWLALPVYFLKYPGRKISGGCLINIFSAKLGKNVKIGRCSYLGESVSIGDYSYISSDSNILHVRIGKYCSFGSELRILAFGHNYSLFSTYPFYKIVGDEKKSKLLNSAEVKFYGETNIGNDVWIGDRVTILGGAQIEDGVVIGANSLVKDKLKAYGIYAGVPAKLIKYRFSKAKIRQLLKEKWWSNDINVIINKALEEINELGKED